MRTLFTLLPLSLLIIVAGCSAPNPTADVLPTPQATLASYVPGTPIETTADAATVANKIFTEKGGAQWTEGPQTVFAQEMSYEEAQAQIGIGEGEYNTWPPDTRVWLVVFKGQWLLAPLDPSQADPTPLSYAGCGFTLFTARDGEFMAMGDASCPIN